MTLRRAVAVLAVIVSLVLSPNGEPAKATEWPVAQWNMEASVNPLDNQASVDLALYLVHQANPRPWAVVRNEVCYSQYAEMKNHYGPMGYATTTINWVVIHNASSACPDGQSLGNVVFLRGGSPSHAIVTHSQSSSDTHYRRAVCNRVVTFFGSFAACSDHFTPSNFDATRPVAQANELLFAMSSLYPGISKWALGDFNLRPPGAGGTAVPAGWYTNYWEADPYEGPTRCSSGGTCIKNDFIFGARNIFGSYRYASILNLDESDHHYFTGIFTT